MLPLNDNHIRLMVLCHVVARFEQSDKVECEDVGIEPANLDRLRQLPLADLKILASLRDPLIGVVVDGTTLSAGLRNLAAIRETRSLEQYFIRHGASPRMLRTLFKIGKKAAILRLRAQGHPVHCGRAPMPPMSVRDRMHQFWAKHAQLDIRHRYCRLHEAFPSYSLHTLNGVINEFEVYR